MCAHINLTQVAGTLWYTPLTNMPLTKLEEQVFALEELVRRLMNVRCANGNQQEAHQITQLWNNYLEVCNSIELHYKNKPTAMCASAHTNFYN